MHVKILGDVIIFKLKEEPGFFDAGEFSDGEMSSVPEETIYLSLENAIVIDEDISQRPHLSKLRCIDLDSTRITDKSIEKISPFQAWKKFGAKTQKFQIKDSGNWRNHQSEVCVFLGCGNI